VYVWDGSTVVDAGTGTLFSLPAWSTDGRLVFSDNDLYIWEDGGGDNEGTITQITSTPDLEELNPHWINLSGS
ncbi:MAG TPA: hypothetical protein VHL11_10395, partial [Phototrophicaceae bacterium]|nr:hypothetical protein [Phototrophicaceae bacterium]